MPTLLQINVTANWGSTGRIAEDIGRLAMSQGWESYIAYGRHATPSKSKLIKCGSLPLVYEHYAEYRLFDNDGLASRLSTKQLVRKIKALKPDIIHLHNIHDHWLNYQILFEYLNTVDIPIVWTQHDCWSFTGGCAYFTISKCKKWKSLCDKCLHKKGILPLIKQTKRHYEKKKALFNGVKNLTLVSVSHWLEEELRLSFLGRKQIHTIYNGVDTAMFRPIKSDVKGRYGIGNKALLIGVATAWTDRKGLKDYYKLCQLLPDNIQLMLVGLTEAQIRALPKNILGVEKTQNLEDLVNIYSGADIVMNLSYEETFGLTTVEGFACGTPSIVFNSTASPELVTPETGVVVESGDIKGVAGAVNVLLSKDKPVAACRERAVKFFDKNERFGEYIKLYDSLLLNYY